MKKNSTKKANILVAFITVLAVAASSAIVLTALNTTVEYKNSIKSNVSSKYNREALANIVLDQFIASMEEARTTSKGNLSYDGYDNVLNQLKSKYSPGSTFVIEDIAYLVDYMEIPSDYGKLLTKSLGTKQSSSAESTLSDDLSVARNSEGEETSPDMDRIPIQPFQITVELKTKRHTSERTWEVENAMLVIDKGLNINNAKVDFSEATFTISESNI